MKKKPLFTGLICALALILVGLIAAVILLGGKESPETAAVTTPVPSDTFFDHDCTTPGDTTPEITTPEVTTPPATTPAPTTPPMELSLDQDPEKDMLVWTDTVTLSGIADPATPITVEGVGTMFPEVDGRFSFPVPVQMGKQTVTLTCGQESFDYEVERRYAMQSFSPSTKTNYYANQTLSFRVMVKENATLKVEFQGKEITMRKTVDQLGSGVMDGFVLYVGGVGMPMPSKEKNLGKVTYTVTCDGITETYQSEDIICAAKIQNVLSDKSVTPDGYWNVGSGYIVEITDVSVETLNGKGSHDRSDPTNNYLPRGTVDYGSEGLIINEQNPEVQYRLLRCGVRVYSGIKNTPNPNYSKVIDCYYGKLPDHNEIGLADFYVEGHHTYLTLDCMWKAPFYFDFEEQEYEDVSRRKYYVEKFDARYVDITFCYADRIEGAIEIGDDHPLFKSAEIIKNKSDMTLRLWLKEEGGLYGWDAYYNEDDQLVFQFLNPVTVAKADNEYGADLTGVTIMLDIGHGGEDIGAAGRDSNGVGWTEKERNLLLGEAVKRELEKTGATVIMNRTTPTELLTQRERIQFLKQVAPDYCLAIHHNSNTDPSLNGYDAGFYYPWTQRATEHTVLTTRETGIYNYNKTFWFYYYVSRQTVCPVILSENGYMSNTRDMDNMLPKDIMERKAQALAQGVVNYFLEMNDLYTAPATE